MMFLAKDNLLRITAEAYVTNLNGKQNNRMHWISFFIEKHTFSYFNWSGSEYIPQDVLNKIKDKSITCNIFRIQENDPIMLGLGFRFIAFIEYMTTRKALRLYQFIFSWWL